jgi:MFS family permease
MMQQAELTAKLRTMRLVFGMAGVGLSVWAVTVPYTKLRFHLDDGTLGMMLLAGGSGGIICMPFAGMAVARWGSRAVILACGLVYGALLPGLSMAPTPASFTALLLLYGALFGMLDVALNAQGAVIERLSGRLQMSGFHGCYSLGSLAVTVLTSFLLRAGLTYATCATLDTLLVLGVLTQATKLIPDTADTPPGPAFALPNRASLVLGLCCFATFLTEGATTDWSAIFLHFSRGMPLASATLGYAAFAVSTAGTRLLGDRVTMRLGTAMVARLGCAIAIIGLLVAVFVPSDLAGIIGFGMVGLGTGNIAPLIFSAATRIKGMEAHHAVPAVVGLGYAGFLAGPVLIGVISNHFGLSAAFLLEGTLLAGVFCAAKAVAPGI